GGAVVSAPCMENYNFGDIIAFPKVMGCKCMPLATYKHYAVYVGKEEFEGKKPDEDIFHLTGSVSVSDCVFGKLSTQGEHELDNYLDTIWTIDPVHIKQRIKELHKNCPAEKSKEFRIGSWKPFSHNCEHIANYVRYGNEVSLQEVCPLDAPNAG
uniref:LRAT domain-containing protein n=1 Tax=Cyprinodon variegatus TaxID=28743 RepID=A0A3Q2GI22_CYPVA